VHAGFLSFAEPMQPVPDCGLASAGSARRNGRAVLHSVSVRIAPRNHTHAFKRMRRLRTFALRPP
jgi:hypothetical protein